jgi:hypothetical protein
LANEYRNVSSGINPSSGSNAFYVAAIEDCRKSALLAAAHNMGIAAATAPAFSIRMVNFAAWKIAGNHCPSANKIAHKSL